MLNKEGRCMAMMINQRIFLVLDISSILRCGQKRVYELIHNGELKAYKDSNGRSWKITEDALNSYIETHNK